MLNQDMKAIIKQANLSFVATINQDGSPNLSPKSTLRPYDDDSLIFADLASPGTIKNLSRNPSTEVNCIDVFSRRGYRFTGKSTVHSPKDIIYDKFNNIILAELGQSTTVHHVVLIKLTSVNPILSPAYNNPSVTEEKLRESYFRKYGVT